MVYDDYQYVRQYGFNTYMMLYDDYQYVRQCEFIKLTQIISNSIGIQKHKPNSIVIQKTKPNSIIVYINK
jgi:hypothetical protein